MGIYFFTQQDHEVKPGDQYPSKQTPEGARKSWHNFFRPCLKPITFNPLTSGRKEGSLKNSHLSVLKHTLSEMHRCSWVGEQS